MMAVQLQGLLFGTNLGPNPEEHSTTDCLGTLYGLKRDDLASQVNHMASQGGMVAWGIAMVRQSSLLGGQSGVLARQKHKVDCEWGKNTKWIVRILY